MGYNDIEDVSVDTSGDKIYDAHAKRLFGSRELLSYLVSELIEDLKDRYTREDVYCRLGCETIDQVKSHEESEPFVKMDNSERNRIGGKKLFMDTLVTLLAQDEAASVCFVNVEAQNDPNVKYSIEHRALVYFARLIEDMAGSFTGDESYKNLRKVYAIWIVRDTGLGNRIDRYRIVKNENEKKHIMNLMEIVIVRFNNERSNKGDIYDFLEGLLVEKDIDKKREKLKPFVNLDKYIEKEISSMGNYAGFLISKGEDIGIDKGIDISATIVRMYLEHNDIDTIVETVKCEKSKVIRILKKSGLLQEDYKDDNLIPDSLKEEYKDSIDKYFEDIESE